MHSETMKTIFQLKPDVEGLKDSRNVCEGHHDTAHKFRRKSDEEMLNINATLKATKDAATATQVATEGILGILTKYEKTLERSRANYEAMDKVESATKWTIGKVKEICVLIASVAVAYYYIIGIFA